MKQAIVAIEDRRFWTNEGIDLRGIGRALYQDVRAQGAVQGGSTITMQLVKIFLAAENERTVFNKLREAALAYEITRKWSKEEILRIYLNTIYFGNGAYGVESAARTYFGTSHPGCGEDGQPRCAQMLAPHEAALIAGMVASPSHVRPAPQQGRGQAAPRPRPPADARAGVHHALAVRRGRARVAARRRATSSPPIEDTTYPYFTSWVKQQVVDKFGGGQAGARRAFEGGLTIRTTLDSRLQEAAQDAVERLAARARTGRAPRSSRSTTTRARSSPWSAATTTRRGRSTSPRRASASPARPSSRSSSPRRSPRASRPTRRGPRARSTSASPKTKKGRCKEYFNVNNYEDAYAGVQSLRTATTYSDNSVYAQVGEQVGHEEDRATSRAGWASARRSRRTSR